MPSFQVLVLGFLFVSFRPSSLRSHSCSTSASLSGSPLPIRFLSSASILASHYSASVSSFPFSSCFRLTVASSVLRYHFRSCGLPRSLLPGFPCIPSRFRYSASCLFPFILPCFAPTAVPQVLPFWISPRGSTPDFRFLTSASVLASHYSASVSPFRHPRFRLTVASAVPVSAFASPVSPLAPA